MNASRNSRAPVSAVISPGFRWLLGVVFTLFALIVVNSIYLSSITAAEYYSGLIYQDYFYLLMFLLHLLLGLLLVVYSAVSLAGLRFTITARHEAWAGPLLGTANGILTGMTGSFVVPGVLFLQSIGLSRDMLIQAMGMLFTVSTLALAVALQRNSLLTVELGGLSAMALLPAISGMVAGQRIRQNLSETLFRRVFFVALLLLGAYIIASALSGNG